MYSDKNNKKHRVFKWTRIFIYFILL
jgi:hypothetical protein